MATGTKTKTGAGEALKQLTYLAAALKAPRITEATARHLTATVSDSQRRPPYSVLY
jgi:hypothetical protein